MTGRDRLHELVDHLPASEVAAAEGYLTGLIDPVALVLLNAEPDDEPLTAAEVEAFTAAQDCERRGEPLIPHDELLREYGLVDSDLP